MVPSQCSKVFFVLPRPTIRFAVPVIVFSIIFFLLIRDPNGEREAQIEGNGGKCQIGGLETRREVSRGTRRTYVSIFALFASFAFPLFSIFFFPHDRQRAFRILTRRRLALVPLDIVIPRNPFDRLAKILDLVDQVVVSFDVEPALEVELLLSSGSRLR